MANGEVGRRYFAKRLLYLLLPMAVIVIGVWAYFIFFKSHDPIPKSVRSQVSFTLYYPGSLPKGWSLDRSSFYANSSDEVAGYLIKGPQGNLNITVQPVPKNFDFTNLYSRRLTGTVQFLTPLGQGAIGRASSQLVGSLVTPSSWVLASPGSSGVTQADMQYVLSHLQSTSP